MVVVVATVVVVEVDAVVVLVLVTVGLGALAGGLVVVVVGRRVAPGEGRGNVAPGVVDEDVVEAGSVEVVDDEVEELVGAGGPPSRRSRPRLSGEAVCTGWTGSPATAGFMVAAQISAGNDPPVTLWPCTSVMGTILSGWPTHTAVESCGTNPTNQASP